MADFDLVPLGTVYVIICQLSPEMQYQYMFFSVVHEPAMYFCSRTQACVGGSPLNLHNGNFIEIWSDSNNIELDTNHMWCI